LKKLLLVYAALTLSFLGYFLFYYRSGTISDPTKQFDNGLHGEIAEKYVMVTFESGIDYWKSCLKGFEDAAQGLNVSVEYHGATQYDAHEEMTVLEQVIAKKPAGIALSAIHPEALNAAINKAVDAGIPVVLFDSGAPKSKANSFLATNNYNAGVTAARQMGALLGESGKVAVVTTPNQLNHDERTSGFSETMHKQFPKIDIVAIEDGKGDAYQSQLVAGRLIRDHPDLNGIFATEANGGVGVGNAVKAAGKTGQIKIIGFDTDKGTLDMVKDGVISMTLAQGTWNMGYWSLQFLFHLHHNLLQPLPNGKRPDTSLLPAYVDTGITVVTKENVENYYAK
jgi:ribose transport system substrate-binding protein